MVIIKKNRTEDTDWPENGAENVKIFFLTSFICFIHISFLYIILYTWSTSCSIYLSSSEGSHVRSLFANGKQKNGLARVFTDVSVKQKSET